MIDRAILTLPDKPFDFFNDYADTCAWLKQEAQYDVLTHLTARKEQNDWADELNAATDAVIALRKKLPPGAPHRQIVGLMLRALQNLPDTAVTAAKTAKTCKIRNDLRLNEAVSSAQTTILGMLCDMEVARYPKSYIPIKVDKKAFMKLLFKRLSSRGFICKKRFTCLEISYATT